LYRLTWSHQATPAGRWISRLRASARRTSDKDCIGWATPKAEDAESTGFSAKRQASGKTPDNLHSQTKLLLAGWATPAERDYRTPNHQPYADRGGGAKGEQLNNQVAHFIPGASLNGLAAPMAGSGLLNPDHSRWLQGVPETWPSCAPTATRSTRGLPRK
jgi:hypothetical protein